MSGFSGDGLVLNPLVSTPLDSSALINTSHFFFYKVINNSPSKQTKKECILQSGMSRVYIKTHLRI